MLHVRGNFSNFCNRSIICNWYRLRQISESQRRSNPPRPVTIEIVNAAIIVLLILLAAGVVVSPLLRLRAWLKRTPPGQEFQPPPDEDAE
jgi:hypothetical protein